jgi:heavy metal efflux system protein
MLNKIIHFSIHNKLIVGLLMLGLVVFGTFSLRQLPIDAVPDITDNQVQIATLCPSLAAQDIERLVTFPIEQAVATIPNKVEIRSISRFGLSIVTIVFKDDVDVYWARQQVAEGINQAKNVMPVGLGEPELMPVSSGLSEIYQYILRPKKGFEHQFDAMSLRTLQEWIVRRQLLGTEGVADVSSLGGYLKQYEIAIQPDRLRAMNVTLSDIFTAVEMNNQNAGGSYIEKKPNTYFIRTEGFIEKLTDIEKIVVKNTASGAPILIRDVATVQLGYAPRYGAMTYNAEGEVVGGIVLMLKGANSSEVIGKVKKRVEQIQKSLPEGVLIEPFLDRTRLVNNAISTVTTNLAEGALIVVFVLVLLLGNWRAGLIVASVIPLAMLFAVILMNLFGVSGNLMSLGAIDFGLIVDGAVIIVEATLHHLLIGRQNGDRLTQAEMDNEVFQSAAKIRNAAAFGEIIILIVYLPLLALVGVEGKMFQPMAMTVSFAILGAFLLSLTYVPMMSSLFLSKKISTQLTFSDRFIRFCKKIYTPVLNATLKRGGVVVGVSIGLFVVSLWVFAGMGGEFIPKLDEGDFAIETRLMTGASLDQTVEITSKASEILLEQFPEVVKTVGKIGAPEIPTDPMPFEACDLMIILKDKDEWTSAETKDELAEKMSKALEPIVGVEFGFQQPIEMRFNELMTGVKQDVAVKIFGENLSVLTEQADKIAKIVSRTEGVQDVQIEAVEGLPQIVVEFDRDRLAQFGLNIGDANRLISTAFAGGLAGVAYENERRFDVVVRLDKASRQRVEDVQNLTLHAPDGHAVPLNQIANVSMKTGINEIAREDAKRRITVAFNVRGRDVETVVAEIEDKMSNQHKFPVGYYATFGGQFENLKAAKERLSVAVPIALLLIFTLLFFTFGSFKQGLLIFTAIPLSAIGGIFALWLRDMPFSISAGVGFIALFGVAVLNGIVLIAEFNALKKSGETDLLQIILRGTETRLRPVLMTALVASLGFLPMALSNGAGAEVQRPLATVVIGGLISATLLTLLVLPVLYIWVENLSRMGRSKTLISTVVLVFIANISLYSQNDSQKTTNLEELIVLAKQNNPSLKAGTYRIQQAKILRGAAFDIPKTDFGVQLGQYNSIRFDQQLGFTQTIPHPKLGRAQAAFADATTQSKQIEAEITERELVHRIRLAYAEWVFLNAKAAQLQTQDSILQNFVRAAAIRVRTGESSALEKLVADNHLAENRHLQQQNVADIATKLAHLQLLTNAKTPLSILPENFVKHSLSNTYDAQKNPIAQLYRQQITVQAQATAVEKARLLPDFLVGYYNTSLIGVQNVKGVDKNFNSFDRFHYVQMGVAVPIFTKAQRARVAASEMEKQVVETETAYQIRQIEGQIAETQQQLAKYQTAIDFYEKTALPTANTILQRAQTAFRAGEIGYIEYLSALKQVNETRLKSLEAIRDFNSTVLLLNYLGE